jgi:cytochrome c biogenesis protein CcdA
MALLLAAYVIVAFVAGLVALAMPCCFSVLLPSYFAQSFRHKTRRLGMTLIFGIGIATVMLPIAIGIVALARTITASHSLVFVVGGFIMIILGFWTLWGRGMLPRLDLPVNLNRSDAPSVYILGVFSGAATTCCAPVLAGVIVLGALSSSLFESMLIGITYVAGMVLPLFIVATIWDKYALNGENPFRGRVLRLKYFGGEFDIHSSKLIAGAMFVVMGIVTVVLGLTGTMIQTPGAASVGVMQAQLTKYLVGLFSNVSLMSVAQTFLGVGLILVFGRIIFARVKAVRRTRNDSMEDEMGHEARM